MERSGKIVIVMLTIVIALTSRMAYAQSADPDLTPQVNPDSVFAPIQRFIILQVPLAIDNVGNVVGLVPNSQIIQDHENIMAENQLEELQVLDEVNKGNINDNNAQNELSDIKHSEIDEDNAVAAMATASPTDIAQASDDLNKLAEDDNAQQQVEVSSGTEIDDVNNQVVDVSTISPPISLPAVTDNTAIDGTIVDVVDNVVVADVSTVSNSVGASSG